MATPVVTREQYEEAERAYREHGTYEGGARALGLSRNTLKHRVLRGRQLGYNVDPAVQESMNAVGAKMVPALAWAKTQPDEEGRSYSVLLKPQAPEPEDIAERVRERLESIPAIEPTPPPLHDEPDLLGLIPVADLHSGMMAWEQEAGEDYDTKSAMQRLIKWTGQLVRAMPRCAMCVLLFNGDTLHANSDEAVTPRSKHALDVDTRHFRTIDLTIEGIAIAVEQARQWHGHVQVVIKPGNHDPEGYMALLFGLSQRYRLERRVSVLKCPKEFWCYRWGRTLILSHHGHRSKPAELVLNLADQYAEEWGQTRYRYLWTGHFHHLRASDIGGVQWEQSRAAASRDAHAAAHGYPARSELQAVIYHSERGEIGRHRVAS